MYRKLILVAALLALAVPVAAQPVVNPPCGVPYTQVDPVDGRTWQSPGWTYVELDATGAFVRLYCPAAPTPAPTPEPPPPDYPVRGFMPLLLRRGG